ncbi:hypothetical protein PoB_005319400 [Plakobranchus ocellatus]|uniref:GIY-YIG domain-containing protein n=1 Tax=Plakobranchus ocellatus TaxID=259542 RepID=A0AAV4C2D4_9GAST|nr:hypothetical protein PoB_005319400 [Plakobranchus ocellatus]
MYNGCQRLVHDYSSRGRYRSVQVCSGKWKDPNSTTSSSFLCHLIKIILTCNCFQFADDMWLQIHGAAMGTCIALIYGNLFMGELEDKLLASAATKPKIWLRYIDDIWTHGRSNLDTFIAHANNFHPSIKFSSTIPSSHVPFLDVLISLSDGILHTDLYSKPTDTFNYLHWSSCHPYHTKKNIPYSLAFRLIRIGSSEKHFTNRRHQPSLHLQSRGYPLRHIKSAITKAKQIPRHSAIQKRNNVTSNKNERIPFVLTYNPALPNVSSILKTYFPILYSSDRCKKSIPSLPVTAFRRPKNLRDVLVHSSTHHTNNIGFSPCLSPRCKTCIYTHTTSSFKSSTDGQTYKITQGPRTCNSNNIIYLITCQKCLKQYVGQTCQTLRSRFNHHRFTIHPTPQYYRYRSPSTL